MKVLAALVVAASLLAVASATGTICKGYTVTYTATDVKWADLTIESILKAAGLDYTITLDTTTAGKATFTIQVDASVSVTISKTLTTSAGYDKYVKSIVENSSLCPTTVAPAKPTPPVTKCIIVKASAGDYPWIVNSVKKALAPLKGVTFTIVPTTGAPGYTYAKLTIKAPASALAAVTAALKPDAYVISYTTVPCAPAVAPAKPKPAPSVTKCILVKASAGDYPWIVNSVKKALAPLASKGGSYTIAPASGPAGYTYAKITITAPASQYYAIKLVLKPDAYIISYTEVPCAAPVKPKPVVAPVKPKPSPVVTKCVLVKASAGDYPWIVNAVKKALAPLASKGVSFKIEQTTGPAGYTYAKLTIKAPGTAVGAIMAALKPDAYIISFTPVACAAVVAPAKPKPTPLVTKCIVVKAAAGDYPWIVNSVKKALGPLGFKYTIAPRSGPAGYTYATITITAPAAAYAKIKAALKPDAYILSYTEGACVAPVVAPVVAPTCRPYIVKAKAGDFKWIVNSIQKALAPLASQGVTFTLTETTGAPGFSYAKLTIKVTNSAVWKAVDAALKPDAYIISFTRSGTC